jgi:WD40 repeat protein
MANQQVKLWDIANNRVVGVLHHRGNPQSLAYTKDGKSLVAASHRAVRRWNLVGSGEKRILFAHGQGLAGAVFSPDGKLLASAGMDAKVKLWDPATGQLLHEFTDFRYSVQALAFSPDSRKLATGDWAGAAKVWDVKTGKLLASPNHDSGSLITSVAFSPDGHYLAASGCGCPHAPKGGVTMWRVSPSSPDQEAGAELSLHKIAGPPDPGYVCGLAFSPDNTILAWVREDHTVHIWDLLRSRELSLHSLPSAGYQIAFLPEGKHLTILPETGFAEVWNCATGEKAFSLCDGQSAADAGTVLDSMIAQSGDGTRIASVAWQGSVVSIWDTRSRKRLLALPEEQSPISCMAWSPDLEQLAVGCSDGGLVIWNLAKVKALLDEIGLGW